MSFLRKQCVSTWMFLAMSFASAPASGSQQVTLPLADYEALRHRAAPPEPTARVPAAPFALESAEVELVVGRSSARVTLRLVLTLYDDAWQTLALPADGNLTSVELGTLEGRVSSPLDESGNAARILIGRGAGRHELRFNVVVPVDTDPLAARATRRLSLSLPSASMVTGVIRSDNDADELVLVSGALERDAGDDGARSFVGEPGGLLEVEILGETTRADIDGLPLVFETSSAALTHVSRRGAELTGFIRVDIVRGRMESLRVPLPSDMNVLHVETVDGPQLGWALDRSGELVLRFGTPATGSVSIELALLSPTPGFELEEFAMPLLAPEGASRATLLSGLSVDDDGIPVLVRASSARRATEEDEAFLPDAFRRPNISLFVVRQTDAPPQWRVEWAEAEPTSVLAAQVDRLIVDALVGESGGIAYQYWMVTRSAGALSLTVRPPDGFLLVKASRAGEPISLGASAEGIEVPLSAGRDPQVIYISGMASFTTLPDKGRFEIPLPSLSAPIAHVELRVVLPGEMRYELDSKHMSARIGSLPDASAQRAHDRSWFTVPGGYETITASWNAIDMVLEPLAIRARKESEKRRWY